MKIAAVFGSVGPYLPKEYVERMCQAQVVHQWHSVEVFKVSGGAIGIVRTSERYGAIPMFFKSRDGNLLAISGVPTKLGQLKAFLYQIVEMNTAEAFQALTEIDGAYAAVFWHEKEKTALLVPDFMGFQPVYYHRAHKGVAYASEIKAFSVAGIVPVKPDPAGWGAFVVFGHTVGEHTQLAGVSRLRGERIFYDPENNNLTKERYWNWPQKQVNITYDNVPIEPIVNCLRSDIDAYKEYGVENSTLLMSSGLDSRLLLCILDEKKIPIKSFSVQQPAHFFGAEGKLGQKVAKQFGINDAKLSLPFTGFEEELASMQYLIMNDVASPGLSLFISKVAGHIFTLTGSIWEGWAPGNIATQFTCKSIDDYLRSKWKRSERIWGGAENIFTLDFLKQMQRSIDERLQAEIGLCGNDDFGIKRFFLKNRALNRTTPNPLKVYSNTVIPFMPGLSKEIWNNSLRLPPYQLSRQKTLSLRIFKDVYPKAMELPFCNEQGLYMVNSTFGGVNLHPQ
ncbi:hypothetical protein DO021_12095 [Desulfobacter hydrogenophilus]|uniref:asparagine synthase (glutamine-hydrolyzing) n=1 Tax=Desulfobacter hydrogenophilus TaxID=2291 RepID=A0A328FAH3_9BACT|nr:hypothetical protein [Desulfobacter hydrogenophilus]NDY72405.1 hypothetical protein [Desulfobacter hydrogenophilus]QBH13729.1 hypothetical protein EYB58_12845 [Desulfobacter hydrogenophilus]RAM01674.1 hypothetical protein DO021_12095 [Desulfobacter hydrogenophilus]